MTKYNYLVKNARIYTYIHKANRHKPNPIIGSLAAPLNSIAATFSVFI